ncbi:MAG: hypothetical protein ACKO8U_18725 [Pirellula sp.]
MMHLMMHLTMQLTRRTVRMNSCHATPNQKAQSAGCNGLQGGCFDAFTGFSKRRQPNPGPWLVDSPGTQKDA